MADPTDKQPDLFGDDFFSRSEDAYLPYKMDRATYEARKRDRHAAAVATFGFGIAGELGQFLIGQSTFNDPVIKNSIKELGELDAKADAPVKGLSATEKDAFRKAAFAPVQRIHDRRMDMAKNIAASVGDNSAEAFLAASRGLAADAADKSVAIEAKIAQIDLTEKDQERAQKEKAKMAAKSIRAMLLKLREERVREPLSQLIGNAAARLGQVAATAPGKDFSAEMKIAVDEGADVDDIMELQKMQRGLFPRARMRKKIKEIIKEEVDKDPQFIAGEGSEARQRAEDQKAFEDAEEATDLSRFARGAVEGRTPEVDTVTEEPEAFDFGIDDSEMTEAQRREMAGLEGDISERERSELMRAAMGATYQYQKSDLITGRTQPNSYEKDNYTYVYNKEKRVWTVFEGNKKLDYELPIEEAKNSIVPGELELYQLAVRDGLYDEDEDTLKQALGG